MRALVRYLPAAALTLLAATLVLSSDTRAFTTLGFSLAQGLRDVRVFNNFGDATANDNIVAQADWPGFTGAPLAIWKACSEWSSQPHNLTGNGDPHQPGGVGSGGANFDITWQGLATSIGGPGDRVHSEISGSNGGVIAYTEGPLGGPWNTGWRIRYYAAWTFDDGPGTSIAPGAYDLQAVATHEYGHALGLGHSTTSTATMLATALPDNVLQRSIEADDILGVQSIYNALNVASKPQLTALALNGTTLTVTGSNFAASGNEIWFTRLGPNASGTPLSVTGLNSNGTTLVATLPIGVGAGDVLVKKGGASGNAGLSNALAFDPQACAGVTSYCTSGLSSNFCTPHITSTGLPSASATSGFTLRCDGLDGARTALIFYGVSGRTAVTWGIGGSTWLCVAPPTQRTTAANSGGTSGGCDGAISIDWLAFVSSTPGALGTPLQAGTTVQAQGWYRDPPTQKKTGLSDAIEFSVCP